jgi:hypothetical protein
MMHQSRDIHIRRAKAERERERVKRDRRGECSGELGANEAMSAHSGCLIGASKRAKASECKKRARSSRARALCRAPWSDSQSVSSRSPRAHHATVSQDGSAPLGQHKYRVLARSGYSISLVRSVSPSTQCDLRCSLPYTTGRDCDRQSGGGWGEGWGVRFCHPSSLKVVHAAERTGDAAERKIAAV